MNKIDNKIDFMHCMYHTSSVVAVRARVKHPLQEIHHGGGGQNTVEQVKSDG